MKQFATVKVAQAASRLGEQAPAATACCNACRTCLTTNLIGVAGAVLLAATGRIAGLARRARRA